MIPSFGCDRPEKYQYAPMTQYFMKDYDPISNECRRPIDPSTHQPVELLPNGPLLDYLRVPYQFQQINETAVSAAQLLALRRQEVAKNRRPTAEAAQQVADQLIAGGIKGIWNFAPTHLDVPPNILVQYENMATSLAVLSVHLQAQIKEEKEVRK